MLHKTHRINGSALMGGFTATRKLILGRVGLRHRLRLGGIFTSFSATHVYTRLSILIKHSIHTPKDVLFLSRVRTVPRTLTTLHCFCRSVPRLPIVTTNSLLRFALDSRHFSVPIKHVSCFRLKPVSFQRFIARARTRLLPCLRRTTSKGVVPRATRSTLLGLMHACSFMKNVPRTILTFIRDNSTVRSIPIRHHVLRACRSSFPGCTPGISASLVRDVFHGVPTAIKRGIGCMGFTHSILSHSMGTTLGYLLGTHVYTSIQTDDYSTLPLRTDLDSST